jgi:hypothetical protein
MPLPGAEVNILDIASPAGDPADTGVTFFVGQTPRGPLGPTPIANYGDLVRIYGDKPANGVLHDAVETAFATGLARGYMCRVVSEGSDTATLALPGPTSGTSLTVSASSPGVWGNSLKVEVLSVSGGRVRLVVTLNDVLVEQSPAAATRTELLTWATDSAVYVNLAAGANVDLPVVDTAEPLAGGDDDAANVNPDAYQAALDLITPDEGTGQLTAPGISDEDVHLLLLAKASDAKCQRFAPLDTDPSWDAAATLAHAAILRASGDGEWGTTIDRVRVPAPGGGIRFVPGSAFWCGRAAFTDATEGPGQPPMGQGFGEHPYILDVEKTYTDDEREALNEAGHTVIARIAGSPRIYGARTLADTAVQPAYKWVGGSRSVMRYRVRAQSIMEAKVGRRIKGDRSILIDLSSELNGMSEQERVDGNLYGNTSAEAFLIDTRYPSVNTDQTLADGYLLANGEIRTAPVAERVRLNLAVRGPADQITSR